MATSLSVESAKLVRTASVVQGSPGQSLGQAAYRKFGLRIRGEPPSHTSLEADPNSAQPAAPPGASGPFSFGGYYWRATTMGHANADIDRFLHLLRSRKGLRDLSAALRELGVPRGTYYYWKKQLAGAAGSPTGIVRRLQQERTRLAKRVVRLEGDLLLAQEALGKPWRRWPPGGPPSAGR